MAMENFHLFPSLPRELQIRIFEMYQADAPHFHHVFGKLRVPVRYIYAAFDEGRDRVVTSGVVSRGEGPDKFKVVDPAMTPDERIPLLSKAQRGSFVMRDRGGEWTGRPLTEPVPEDSYARVNVKYDTFGFSPTHSGPNILAYMEGSHGIGGMFPAGQPGMDHWFYRFQNLEFASVEHMTRLGPFDRWALGPHPCLKSITLVLNVVHDVFPTAQLALLDLSRDKVKSNAYRRRLPLTIVEPLLSHAGDPDQYRRTAQRVRNSKLLRQDIVDLFQETRGGRGDLRAPVVTIELYVFWPPDLNPVHPNQNEAAALRVLD